MIDQETLAELAEAIQAVADAVRQDCERLAEAMRQLTAPFAESLRQALEDIKTGIVYEPRKKLPRPPKFAGPQNKGRAWNQQPPRLARSCCRKMRR